MGFGKVRKKGGGGTEKEKHRNIVCGSYDGQLVAHMMGNH